MELHDDKIIAASRERVWAALNDPDVLRQCIPGCKSLEKVDDTHFNAVASLKVGPVKATFNGHVELVDLHPPESYSIVGEGKGGVAGFAKGRADVKLVEEGPEQTRLHYDAKAEVGGKLAQLGSRLIDSTAKKLANEFFAKFKSVVEGVPVEETPEAAAAAATPQTATATETLDAAPEGAVTASPAPPPTRDPAEATVSPAAGGAMQSAASEPSPGEAPAGPAQAATQDHATETTRSPQPASGQASPEAPRPAGAGGVPWKWIAIGAAILVLIYLLFD